MHKLVFGSFHLSVFDGWEGGSPDEITNNRKLSGTWKSVYERAPLGSWVCGCLGSRAMNNLGLSYAHLWLRSWV